MNNFTNDLQIINLSEYYNSGNMPKIYMYEILNKKQSLNALNIKEASINIFKIGNEKVIYGSFNKKDLSMSIIPPSEDQIIRQADLKYRNHFEFYTNQDLPLASEIHNYVFCLKEFQTDPKQKIYIIGNNNTFLSSNLGFENQTSKMWSLELIEFESLDIFKNAKSLFIFEKTTNENRGALESIKLEFKSSALINNIEFIGDISNNNEKIKNTIINFSTNFKNFITLFTIPIFQNDNQLLLYTSWLNKNYSMLLGDIQPGFILGNLTVSTVDYLDKRALDLFYDIVDTTNKLTSGFAGMTDEQIRNFKETKFSGSDPKDYCDFKISQFLNDKEKDYKRKFKNYILALSEYISSSYCWKGGLTQEHKLGLPFYLDYINNTLYYRSSYYNLTNENGELKLENIYQGFLFNNIYSFQDKVIALPLLPANVKEQDLSNSPVDFNKTSYNFNYITYLFMPDDNFKNLVFGNYEVGSNEPESIKYSFEKNLEEIFSQTQAIRHAQMTATIANEIRQKTYNGSNLIDNQTISLEGKSFPTSQNEASYNWNDNVKNQINNLVSKNIDFWAKSILQIPRDAEFERHQIENYDTKFSNFNYTKDNGSNYYKDESTWTTNFVLKINVWYKTKKTVINKLGDPSYIFNYQEWVNFLIKYHYYNDINIIFFPNLENNFVVEKINSISISGFFLKDFSIALKYENEDLEERYLLSAFDKENESFTKTIINF